MESVAVQQKLIVTGEDEESEEEIDIEFEKPVVVVPVNDPSLMHAGKGAEVDNVQISSGEAPESDLDDFDSTVSSTSVDDSVSTTTTTGKILGSSWSQLLMPSGIIMHKSSSRIDPSVLKKQRDRNKSLRTNIFDKFLTPMINSSIRKIDKLSQGLSNSQMQVQDALFQSRIATANLLKLQAEIESFVEADHLRDLKTIDEAQGIRVEAR
ncbi:hypothetical protein Ocin01_04710 [Orchesella cincta]|uniref:Uncharacterized protein n=1 Tax=Orchesella cincta TaxID=48709 RepID=A0A1D2N9P1_ORCCI|nr:hypothetical protein Ocin01_04710 [Orchesella cincta]